MSNNNYLRKLALELDRPIEQLEELWTKARCLVPASTPLEKWFETSKAIFQNILNLHPPITAYSAAEDMESESGVTQKQFDELGPKRQRQYLRDHPMSKYHPQAEKVVKKVKVKPAPAVVEEKPEPEIEPEVAAPVVEQPQEAAPEFDVESVPEEELDKAVETGPPQVEVSTPVPEEKRGFFKSLFSGTGRAVKAVAKTVKKEYSDSVDAFERHGNGTGSDEDTAKVASVTKNIMFGILGVAALAGLAFLAPTLIPLAASLYSSRQAGGEKALSSTSGSEEALEAMTQDIAEFLSTLDPKELGNEQPDDVSQLPA